MVPRGIRQALVSQGACLQGDSLMDRRCSLLLVVVWGSVLLMPSAAAAALLIESLEWVVTDADLVVRGVITDFDRVRDQDEVIWSTATVKIAAVLKGDKHEQIKLIASHQSRFASDRLANLAREKAEILLCLVKSDRYKGRSADYAAQPWALRLIEGEVDHALVDLTGQTGSFVVAMDGRILTKKEDIVQAAAAAGTGQPVKHGRLRAPAFTEVARKFSEGGPVWLLVPLNAQMQAVPRAWLKSRELDERVEAVKALRLFKSEENITLLKELLTDSQGRTEGKTTTYPVRLAAYEVLRQWGVTVPRPVTEEQEK